jgi:hypothetical protein
MSSSAAALLAAAARGDNDEVARLHAEGVDVNAHDDDDSFGRTPVFVASENGQAE